MNHTRLENQLQKLDAVCQLNSARLVDAHVPHAITEQRRLRGVDVIGSMPHELILAVRLSRKAELGNRAAKHRSHRPSAESSCASQLLR